MVVFTERDKALKLLVEGMYTYISTSKHRSDFIYLLDSGCIFDTAGYGLTDSEKAVVKPFIERGHITRTHLIGGMMADNRFNNVSEDGCRVVD